MITRIQTVYVPADDVDAVAQFYEGILGIKPRFRDGDRWVQFSIANAGFAIACKEESAEGASGPVIVFEASEDADHERLLAMGAIALGERDMGSHGRTRTYLAPGEQLIQLLWRSVP